MKAKLIFIGMKPNLKNQNNNFPPLRAHKIITDHVIYNPAYIYKFQLKTTTIRDGFFRILKRIIPTILHTTVLLRSLTNGNKVKNFFLIVLPFFLDLFQEVWSHLNLLNTLEELL